MKRYDIVSLNNELDMLEIRLNILNDYVDYFVIVEATETFSGFAKPLYFDLNKDKFSEFSDKIIHYVVEYTPQSFDDEYCDQEILKMACESDNVTREHLCWLKEFYQKEMIKKSLINLDDDDICFISDVDEIWNYELNLDIGNGIYKPMIKNCYMGYLNLKCLEEWTPETNPFTGPIITKYINVKNNCLNHLRTLRKTNYTFIENGGWHFNALGGVEKKIMDFRHPVYTYGYMINRSLGSFKDEECLPEYIKNNREKYNRFLI